MICLSVVSMLAHEYGFGVIPLQQTACCVLLKTLVSRRLHCTGGIWTVQQVVGICKERTMRNCCHFGEKGQKIRNGN